MPTLLIQFLRGSTPGSEDFVGVHRHCGGAEPVGPRRDTHVAGGDGGVLQVSGVDHFEEHGPSGFVEAAVANSSMTRRRGWVKNRSPVVNRCSAVAFSSRRMRSWQVVKWALCPRDHVPARERHRPVAFGDCLKPAHR
jgi:hypothetical protein